MANDEYREQQTAKDRISSICRSLVDEDGESLRECAWVQSAACGECGGCLCDGSC